MRRGGLVVRVTARSVDDPAAHARELGDVRRVVKSILQ